MLAGHSKLFSWNMYSFDKNLFVGNMLFPHTISNIPQIPVYQKGLKIQTEVDNSSKKIQFTISEDKECRHFYLLITQYIQPKIEDNTVQCLKIEPGQTHKFYKITLIAKREDKNLKDKDNISYSWKVKDKKLTQGIIPDDTLIILFNSDYVEKLDGGNDLELPKIIIKNNILELAGSEKKLHNEANEILMGSLDLNILHIKPTAEVKPEYKKKLVIAMSNSE